MNKEKYIDQDGREKEKKKAMKRRDGFTKEKNFVFGNRRPTFIEVCDVDPLSPIGIIDKLAEGSPL